MHIYTHARTEVRTNQIKRRDVVFRFQVRKSNDRLVGYDSVFHVIVYRRTLSLLFQDRFTLYANDTTRQNILL